MRHFIDSLLGFPHCLLPPVGFWVCGSLCALSFQRGLSVFDGIQLLAKCSGGPFICIAKQSVEWAEYGIQRFFSLSFLYYKTLLLLLVNVLTGSCLRSTGRPQRVTKDKRLNIQVNARACGGGAEGTSFCALGPASP